MKKLFLILTLVLASFAGYGQTITNVEADWEDHWSKPDTGRWIVNYTINGGETTTHNEWDSYDNQIIFARKIFRYGGQIGSYYVPPRDGDREAVIHTFSGGFISGIKDEISELSTDLGATNFYYSDTIYNQTFLGKWYTGFPERCGMVNDTMELVENTYGGIARIKDDLSLANCYVVGDGLLTIPTETAYNVHYVVEESTYSSAVYMRAGLGCLMYKVEE